MVFEPTPALDCNKENVTPLTENPNPSSHHSRSERGSSKEVHFSPVMTPARRSQSLATSVPLLEPISSASQLPRHSPRINNLALELDMNAYMEQSRSLVENQRLNFEREREVFEKERTLWNAERAMLKARIADLEFHWNQNNLERSSNDGVGGSAQSVRKHLPQLSSLSSTRASRGSSETNGFAPVWETPDMGTAVTRVFSTETNGGSPVWETPDMGATVTRVFSAEEQPQPKKVVSITTSLPSIAENATDQPVSPLSTRVPVTVLDSSLDGITLKSAGLESSFVRASVSSTTSPPQPPSPGPQIHQEEKISPTDLALVRDAGHTPKQSGKAATSDETASTAESRKPAGSDEYITKHKADSSDSGPSRPPILPSERSDSYFSVASDTNITEEEQRQENGDVELTGPLAMESKHEEGQDNEFLTQLDALLRVESQRSRLDPTIGHTKPVDDGVNDDNDDEDDEGPKLKLKQSLNFGSVFGSKKCGHI